MFNEGLCVAQLSTTDVSVAMLSYVVSASALTDDVLLYMYPKGRSRRAAIFQDRQPIAMVGTCNMVFPLRLLCIHKGSES